MVHRHFQQKIDPKKKKNTESECLVARACACGANFRVISEANRLRERRKVVKAASRKKVSRFLSRKTRILALFIADNPIALDTHSPPALSSCTRFLVVWQWNQIIPSSGIVWNPDRREEIPTMTTMELSEYQQFHGIHTRFPLIGRLCGILQTWTSVSTWSSHWFYPPCGIVGTLDFSVRYSVGRI